MTTTNATSGTTSATTTNNASLVAKSTQETQDRFLKMLVTQMKNQDPLNPLDNAQITSQMAQLSTVTGINSLNDTVKSLSTSMLSSQTLQAASLVGHNVMTEGKSLVLSGGAAYGGIELASAVDSLTVNVKDSAGKVIYSEDLGAQSAGIVPFKWDGSKTDKTTAADGNYTFEVAAVAGGKKVDATTLSVAQVLSVSLGATGATLNVSGFGALDLSKVKQIL